MISTKISIIIQNLFNIVLNYVLLNFNVEWIEVKGNFSREWDFTELHDKFNLIHYCTHCMKLVC